MANGFQLLTEDEARGIVASGFDRHTGRFRGHGTDEITTVIRAQRRLMDVLSPDERAAKRERKKENSLSGENPATSAG